jgi:hypothetical protein
MSRIVRLDVLITSLALLTAVVAYLVYPNTIDFFAVVLAAMAWTIAIVRAMLDSGG